MENKTIFIIKHVTYSAGNNNNQTTNFTSIDESRKNAFVKFFHYYQSSIVISLHSWILINAENGGDWGKSEFTVISLWTKLNVSLLELNHAVNREGELIGRDNDSNQ